MARNSFALFTQTLLFPVRTCKGRHWKGHFFNVYDAVRSKCSVPRNQILQNFTQRTYLRCRRIGSVSKWFPYVTFCFIPSFICYPVSDSLTHSHTHSHTHTHTHLLTHSFTHPFTHPFTHTHTLTLTHTHTLTLTHTHTLTLTHTHTHILTHSLTHTHSFCLSLSLTHAFTH